MPSPEGVKEYIFEYLAKGAAERGLGRVERQDELHMVDSGLLDSFAFIALLSEIEARFGVEVDLSEAEPDEYLRVGGLSRIAAAASARPAP